MFPGPAGAHDFYQQVAAFERDVLPHSLQQRHAAHYPPFIAQHASVGVDEQLHIERERAWAAQRTAQDALRRVVAFRRMHDVENGQFAHNYARGDDVHRSNIQLLSRNAEPARSGYRHSTMDEEMRLDPADGHLHTLRGFLDYYGQFEGRERWARAAIIGTQPSFVAADTVTHADTAANMDVATDLHMVEPHIDHPSRSREYPDADHKRGAEARPGSDSYMHQYHTHPDTGEEMRIDAADGHLHTLQGFQDFYGDVEGGERWAKSPKTLAEAQAVGLRVAATDASVADPDQDLNAAPELTFSASELKDMMSGGMYVASQANVQNTVDLFVESSLLFTCTRNDAVGGTDPTTGEQFEYVLLLTDEWRERFAQSEQVQRCLIHTQSIQKA